MTTSQSPRAEPARCPWCGAVLPRHESRCLALRAMTPAAGEQRHVAPQAMTRSTLELEVERLHTLERELRTIALSPEADLRHRLAEFDQAAKRIHRDDVPLAQVMRELLAYVLAGARR